MEQSKTKFLPRIESPSRGNKPYVITSDGNPFEMDEEDEEEIFRKCNIALRIPSHCTGDFTHLTVSKNWLVCVLSNAERTTMLRFFLPRAIPPGEIALEKFLNGSGYKITKIFLDPTGYHLVIALVPKWTGGSPDFLYIHANGPKVRRIEKFKDHEITAVAFNAYEGTESSTGPILLGTSRGLIFETELSPNGDTQRRQLYDLGLGRPKYAVTGLEVLRVPNSTRFIVIATTPDSIYTFQHTLPTTERSLQGIFAAYVNGTQEPHCEQRKSEVNCSLLRLYAPPNSKFPKQWAWLSGTGMRLGELSIEPSGSATLLGDTLIKLELEQMLHLSFEQRRLTEPKAFVMTEYHALLLYAEHISAICLLNQQSVYQETFPGKLLGIERDAFTGTIYVYTDKSLFSLRITREERNIWRIYLDRGQFELATAHASGMPEHLQLVQVKRADRAFIDGDYEAAANYYAETEQSFEEVCLKFMVLPDKRPIINYVKKRLSRLSAPASVEQHQNAIKALVIWLIDLYLIQINTPERSEDIRATWQAEYDAFMREPAVLACTRAQRAAVQQLIAQHADPYNLAQFAIAIGDYEQVIAQQVQANRYVEALQTLRNQRDLSLYYKYAPTLMAQLPEQTVDVLQSQRDNLQIEQLVPALIVMETAEQRRHIIRYLEFAIYELNTTNQAIHNFLLHLYAQHDPKLLMKYLEIQGRDPTLLHYDINYALRVCTEADVKVACVFLQCLLCMWAPALDLALTFDMRLAKETASRPPDKGMQRKLWLRIAHHDIKGSNDVKKALSLLKECKLLRIEDLLPFFSDFEKIDNFKEAICDALKDYNQRIQELHREMAECNEQSTRVCSSLQQLRAHSVRIEAHDVCGICELVLLVKPFFTFICGHKFHSDCLEQQVLPMLSKQRSRRLTTLKQQLETLMTQTVTLATKHTPEQQQNRAKIKAEIEEILAADCLYCGLLIDSIDQPFVDDWDQVNVEWE